MITISSPAPIGWKHKLHGFLLATTRRRLQPLSLYQHLLDGSSNSLVLKHQPEDGCNHLPCTTLPPCNVDYFMLCISLQRFLLTITSLPLISFCVLSLSLFWQSYHCLILVIDLH